MAWHWCKCGKHSHHVFLQEKDYSCEIACMLMALQRKGKLNTAGMGFRKLMKRKVVNKPMTAREMREASQELGGVGYYRPGTGEVGAKVGKESHDKLAKILISSLGSAGSGTYFTNAEKTLQKLGFRADYFPSVKWGQVVKFVKDYVVIAQVNWKGGGFHAVVLENLRWKNVTQVVFGVQRKRKVTASLCVCDPGYGAKLLGLSPKGLKPIYRPGKGVAAQFTGDIVVV